MRLSFVPFLLALVAGCRTTRTDASEAFERREWSRAAELYDRVLADVRALPGVRHAGYISGLPMVRRGGIWPLDWEESVHAGGMYASTFASVTVFARGLLRGLHTRVYVPVSGPDTADVPREVPTERARTLVARAAGPSADTYEWDIVLQGTHETVFFEF